MHRGVYESLLTTSLSDRLQAVKELTIEIGTVDQADQPHVLARHVARELERELASIRDEHRRLELVAAVLDAIPAGGAEPVPPARQLLAIEEPSGPGKTGGRVPRPRTPLSDAALLTNAHGEPNLGTQIQAEFGSADQIDLLCAFVKWHGLRLLENDLAEAQRRGAPLRVITTTYMVRPSAAPSIGWSASSARR